MRIRTCKEEEYKIVSVHIYTHAIHVQVRIKLRVRLFLCAIQ
jgi:hypothetical protein